MKKKIAVYHLYGNTISDYVEEYQEHFDEDPDWTQLTEVVEVEFKELPIEGVQEGLIAAVQAKIDHEHAEHLTKMKRLDDQMSKLRALPAPDPKITLGPGYDGEEDVVIHDAS